MSPAPPGPPKHPPEALEVWDIPFNVPRSSFRAFTPSLFLGTALNRLQTDFIKYFPPKPLLTENGFWTQWKLLWRRKMKIKPAQLVLEALIRNRKLFSSSEGFWEGAAAAAAVFSRRTQVCCGITSEALMPLSLLERGSSIPRREEARTAPRRAVMARSGALSASRSYRRSI